jgi:uncharacterized protein YfaP (DUF2135 family)
MKKTISSIIIAAAFAGSAHAATVKIESPRGGYTTSLVQQISGTVQGFSGNRATLVINGIPQTVPLSQGRFSVNAVAAAGTNLIEVIAGDARDKVSFFAKVPARDIKVVLTWDTATDVDLWVIDPEGNKCYYGNRSTPRGGNLDVDITTGYGPETFSMLKALPGTYSVQVQYYSAYDIPVTKVNVYVLKYDGTPKEERKDFQFVMTAPGQVYHICDFQIDPGE